MRLADPGKIISIGGSTARVITREGFHDVSLRLMEVAEQPVAIGDWVLVSLGLVVSVVEDAEATAVFDDMVSMRRGVVR